MQTILFAQSRGATRGAALFFAVVGALVCSQGRAQELPQATREHQAMARDVGEWGAEMKIWMSPDAEPMASEGTETVKMLGDKWLIAEFQGKVMDMDFSGHSQMGYDPHKKKYIGTWIDTLSPYMTQMEGSYDVATHTLTMMNTGFNWEKGKLETSKSVTRYLNNDSKVFEMYAPVEGQQGKWWKMMEIQYNRKAPQ